MAERATSTLMAARRTLDGSVDGLTLDDALDAAGGVRSVLGVLKHAAGWSHVYYSYAFETPPRHWIAVDWPRGKMMLAALTTATAKTARGMYL